ncbi:MAG: hypothetical protein ABSB96_03020 [Gaiellaceae bacterium]
MRERGIPFPAAVFFLAGAGYLISLLLPWYSFEVLGEQGSGVNSIGLESKLGELSALLAIAILVVGVNAIRARDSRLLYFLRQLAIALALFNALSVLAFWRSGANLQGTTGAHLGLAAYASIAISLLVLASVLSLQTGDAGSVERSPESRLWLTVARVSGFVYFAAQFSPWSAHDYHSGVFRALPFIGDHGSWNDDLGIASLTLCYAILAFALPRPLLRMRTTLALGLTGVSITSVYVTIPSSSQSYGFWPRDFGALGYGAWLTLSAALVLLLAVAALDEGGLAALIDKVPAWARLDRLELSEEDQPAAREPGELREKHWTWALVLTLLAYVLTIRMSWWSWNGEGFEGTVVHTRVFPFMFGLGNICTLLAIAILAFAHATRTRRERWLGSMRTALIAALACLTLVSFVLIWREVGVDHMRPDYGSYVALVSLLVMIASTSALNGGPDLVTVARSRGLDTSKAEEG